jgi:hypothetical protein
VTRTVQPRPVGSSNRAVQFTHQAKLNFDGGILKRRNLSFDWWIMRHPKILKPHAQPVQIKADRLSPMSQAAVA